MLYCQTYDCIAIRRVKHNAHHRFQEGSDWNLVPTVANSESSKRPTEILHPVVCMATHSTQLATSRQLLTTQAHPRTHNQQPCEPSEHNRWRTLRNHVLAGGTQRLVPICRHSLSGAYIRSRHTQESLIFLLACPTNRFRPQDGFLLWEFPATPPSALVQLVAKRIALYPS